MSECSRKLVKNAARCRGCNTVLESKHRHDFVTCKCGLISIDGGLAYQRCLVGNPFEDLSEFEEVESDERSEPDCGA